MNQLTSIEFRNVNVQARHDGNAWNRCTQPYGRQRQKLFFLFFSVSLSKMNTKHARNKTTLTLFNSFFVVRSKSTRAKSILVPHKMTYGFKCLSQAIRQRHSFHALLHFKWYYHACACLTIVSFSIPQYLFDVLLDCKPK